MSRETGFNSDGGDRAVLSARYYSHRSKELFHIWREVFGDDKDLIIGVVTIRVRHERKLDESREGRFLIHP